MVMRRVVSVWRARLVRPPRPASKIFIGIVATAVLIDEFNRMVHVRASGPSGKLGSLS
jgi:hypothetical protein